MNIAVLIILILSAWKWADWKNWQKYHPTMLLVIVGNLIYNTLYDDHLLWEIMPEVFQSYIFIVFIYSFIVLPLTALMFLSNLPNSIWKQGLHILKYAVVYTIFEYFFSIYNVIVYYNGWNLWWSLAWNIMMFLIWMVHHRKPLTAYTLSITVIIIMMMLFPVNLR